MLKINTMLVAVDAKGMQKVSDAKGEGKRCKAKGVRNEWHSDFRKAL